MHELKHTFTTSPRSPASPQVAMTSAGCCKPGTFFSARRKWVQQVQTDSCARADYKYRSSLHKTVRSVVPLWSVLFFCSDGVSDVIQLLPHTLILLSVFLFVCSLFCPSLSVLPLCLIIAWQWRRRSARSSCFYCISTCKIFSQSYRRMLCTGRLHTIACAIFCTVIYDFLKSKELEVQRETETNIP